MKLPYIYVSHEKKIQKFSLLQLFGFEIPQGGGGGGVGERVTKTLYIQQICARCESSECSEYMSFFLGHSVSKFQPHGSNGDFVVVVVKDDDEINTPTRNIIRSSYGTIE